MICNLNANYVYYQALQVAQEAVFSELQAILQIILCASVISKILSINVGFLLGQTLSFKVALLYHLLWKPQHILNLSAAHSTEPNNFNEDISLHRAARSRIERALGSQMQTVLPSAAKLTGWDDRAQISLWINRNRTMSAGQGGKIQILLWSPVKNNSKSKEVVVDSRIIT